MQISQFSYKYMDCFLIETLSLLLTMDIIKVSSFKFCQAFNVAAFSAACVGLSTFSLDSVTEKNAILGLNHVIDEGQLR